MASDQGPKSGQPQFESLKKNRPSLHSFVSSSSSIGPVSLGFTAVNQFETARTDVQSATRTNSASPGRKRANYQFHTPPATVKKPKVVTRTCETPAKDNRREDVETQILPDLMSLNQLSFPSRQSHSQRHRIVQNPTPGPKTTSEEPPISVCSSTLTKLASFIYNPRANENVTYHRAHRRAPSSSSRCSGCVVEGSKTITPSALTTSNIPTACQPGQRLYSDGKLSEAGNPVHIAADVGSDEVACRSFIQSADLSKGDETNNNLYQFDDSEYDDLFSKFALKESGSQIVDSPVTAHELIGDPQDISADFNSSFGAIVNKESPAEGKPDEMVDEEGRQTFDQEIRGQGTVSKVLFARRGVQCEPSWPFRSPIGAQADLSSKRATISNLESIISCKARTTLDSFPSLFYPAYSAGAAPFTQAVQTRKFQDGANSADEVTTADDEFAFDDPLSDDSELVQMIRLTEQASKQQTDSIVLSSSPIPSISPKSLLPRGLQWNPPKKYVPKKQSLRSEVDVIVRDYGEPKEEAQYPATPGPNASISKRLLEDRMNQPFVRPSFPKRVFDQSPILGLSSALPVLTQFRLGAALSYATTAAQKPSGGQFFVELYARVISSSRDGPRQNFLFADLFRPDKPPFVPGIWIGWQGVPYWELDGQIFVGPNGHSRMCRVVGKIERHECRSWRMCVLNIWEANWEDIAAVKSVVCER